MEKYILILGSSGLFGTAMEKVCRENKMNYNCLFHNDLEITDKSQLEEKIKQYNPDFIINSVAMLGIDACEKEPLKAFDINSVAVLNLSRLCRKYDVVLVQTSTATIFDGTKGALYVESDIPHPKNIYGLSKYAGEICTRNNLDKYYILRFPKLFGSRQKGALGFIDKMIMKMRNDKELKVADDRIDTFTYTVHAARKVLSLIQEEYPFGMYHISNQGSVSYYDFMCKFAEHVGYTGKITRVKDKDFPSMTLNPLRVDLGSDKIKHMPDWEDALSEYIQSEKIKI